MIVFALWLLKCGINRGSGAVLGEQPNEAVELRLRRFSRNQIHKETQEVFPLPLQEYKEDPAKYMIRLGLLLSRNCISAAVSDMIVDESLQYASERCAGEEKEIIRRLRVVGEVDGVIKLNWTAVGITKEEEDEDPKSETCSICLDELNGGKREEIEVPCGHVYHHLCIFNWLIHNSTCPLCRASLYFPH